MHSPLARSALHFLFNATIATPYHDVFPITTARICTLHGDKIVCHICLSVIQYVCPQGVPVWPLMGTHLPLPHWDPSPYQAGLNLCTIGNRAVGLRLVGLIVLIIEITRSLKGPSKIVNEKLFKRKPWAKRMRKFHQIKCSLPFMPGIFVKEIWPVENVRTSVHPFSYFIDIVRKISKIDLIKPSAEADGAMDGWSTPIVQTSPSVYFA